MEIITSSPIIVQSEITTSKIDVISIIDNNLERNVIANIKVANKECSVMLWELSAYDNIGQWTDDMVVARIKELSAEGKLC
jgi:hypothetical protein